MTNTDIAKLTGGKRKNGHKMDCNCHICENMQAKAKRNGYTEDIEREKERKTGQQKANGHKLNCSCPICKNMKNAKGTKNISKKNSNKNTGKRSNGHKLNCSCPICKNMKKKKGGSDEDNLIDENKKNYENIDNDENKKKYENIDNDENKNNVDNIMIKETKPDKDNKNEIIADDEEYEKIDNLNGGTHKRRRKGKRSNGHKPTCCCPICKNTRKGKKTRKNRRNK
jgi:hypothetical protein